MGDLSGLAQFGVAGIVLAAMLSLFFWAFKRLFAHVLESQVDFKKFMNESVNALTKNTEVTKDVAKAMERQTTRMEALEIEVRKKLQSRA